MTMGLTKEMQRAADAIVAHVGRHGVAPSLQSLADDLGVCKNSAVRLVGALHERGHITRGARGAIALGGGGVSVVIPAEVAAKLAQFCQQREESLAAIVRDAIVLHLDQLGPRVEPP